MKTIFLIAAMAMLCCTHGNAQNYFYNNKYYQNAIETEFGGSFGFMNAMTDLGGKKGTGKKFIKDLTLKTARPSYCVYGLAMYRNAIGVRLEATTGSVVAYDSILKKVEHSVAGRYERNLSFKSKIFDLQLAVEIHPLFIINTDPDNAPAFSPYLVTGIGYFNFNPQASLNGQWISLHPLKTEGQGFKEYSQRKPYKLSQFNITTGLGIKYELNTFNLRFEVIHRILNTDYLDDVSTDYINPDLFSMYLPAAQVAIAKQLYNRKKELNAADQTFPGDQRGDPRDKDAFFTIQFKIGMVIGRQKR